MRDFRPAADGTHVTAKARTAQDDKADDEDRGEDQRRHGQRTNMPGGNKAKRARDQADRPPGVDEHDAAQDRPGAERGDEVGNAQLRHQITVGQPDYDTHCCYSE